jgi:PAS domain S-box-containing protein
MKHRRRSIKDRVRTLILLVSVTVLFMTAAAFVVYEVLSFRKQMVRSTKTLAAVVADNAAWAIQFQNPRTAADILDALQAERDIEEVGLYDLSGNIFARYPANLPTNALPVDPGPAGHRFENRSLIMITPVIGNDGKRMGTLYIRSSLRGMYERFGEYGLIVAVVLVASFGSAFILSSVLQKRISDPILALTSATQKIAQSADYSVRVPRRTEDELGILTDSFNKMIVQTQEHQNRLAEQARLLDLSHDAICVRNMQDRLLFWNSGCLELYGFTRDEAIGRIAHELLHTEFSQTPEEVLDKLQRDNRWNGELIQTTKDGRRIFVASRWSLVRDEDGRPKSILESNTDISERKAFQANLERLVLERTARLQETIGELEAFSYSVSHDMRAPLRAMQGYAKALLSDYKDKLDEEAMHFLDRIARASNRLDLLIQDVLAYSKVAKSEITLSPVNLERLIEDLLPSHPEFQPPNASIVIQRPLHMVLGHEAYLTQCVTNLLGNAVKFVAPGLTPEVRIRSEVFDGKVRLWFEDNGIGIDPSHQDRIFQIFGQVHSEKKYGGTGIGLAIVRKAVQRMNGDVGVISELGKGSRFWITLNQVTA